MQPIPPPFDPRFTASYTCPNCSLISWFAVGGTSLGNSLGNRLDNTDLDNTNPSISDHHAILQRARAHGSALCPGCQSPLHLDLILYPNSMLGS